MATIQERVAERYPDLLPLLHDPEVGRLLRQAVDPKPLSANSFMSKLRTTRWFRSQSEASRRWWVTSRMDPGEANRQRAVTRTGLQRLTGQLGVQLNANELKFITESMMQRGLTPDSPEIQNELLAFGRKAGKIGAGSYRTARRDVDSLSMGQWMAPISVKTSDQWAGWIATGSRTLDDFNQQMAKEAMARFPHMKDQIAAGRSVAEIAQPFVNVYAQEMDWDADGLMAKMWKDPKFAGLLGIRDKSGNTRLPTEVEARKMARQRPDWWGTTGGKEADHGMARTLLNAFGIRKS